jgi:KaiC/GvpD/RAD55 family RecA-like ATPase
LFAVAVNVIDPGEHFADAEEDLQVMWYAARTLYESGLRPPFPIEMLRNEVSAEIERTGCLITPAACAKLYGKQVPPVISNQIPGMEYALMGEFEGIFDRLRRIHPTHLEHQRGETLLRRFLEARHVYLPLQSFLDMPQRCVNLSDLLEELQARVAYCHRVGDDECRALGDEWLEHESWLRNFRGRSLIGLRTGMCELDRRTLGLRDLAILGAPPGVGKTAYALQCAIGVCEHHVDNDAVVVFVTLEMDRKEIISRLKCHLADMDYQVLMRGTPGISHEAASRVAGSEGDSCEDADAHVQRWFDQEDRNKLQHMEESYRNFQLDRRLIILDRSQLGENDVASRLQACIERAKERTAANRALVVIDYVQRLPVSAQIEKQGELVCDRHRVAMLQDLLSRMQAGPLPDCVLAISEARKPPNSKEEWGQGLAELMGSARIGYAAGSVLLFSPMNDARMKRHFGECIDASAVRRRYEERGVALVELNLTKGRDGMLRGSWPAEYHYRRNRFVEIDPVVFAATCATPTMAAPTAPPGAGAAQPRRRRRGAHSMQ